MADQQPEKTTAPAADAPDSQPTVITNTDTPKETTETTTAQPAVETPVAEPTTAETPAEADKAPAEGQQPPQAEEEKPVAEQPEQPAYLAKNPALAQFFERLPAILSSTGHAEMWGVPLKDSDDAPTVNVLIKFLRANEGNVKLAEEQLTKALKWRKEMDPSALAESTNYSAAKFGGLGYLTVYKEANGAETVVTWNIYGGVKDINSTFGDMDEFVKWRVALMELAVKELKMAEATSVIDYDGEDPYQMIQVHDYLNVSFLRLNPTIRAATKKTIEVFTTAYPELLREKFFVNVPAIMGWMFAAMKVFLSKNTTRKFHPISNGANLAREFPSLKEQFPKVYGGSAPALQEGARTVNLIQEEPAPAAPAATEAATNEEPKEQSKGEVAQEESRADSAPEQPKTDTAVTAQEAPAAEAK
ncbi:CRAL/TRIO domain protein [Aspergillus thermomutatus]|uniref:Phosphatidylinositol transfer protein SFH5 n=1 Tax=Aspergillus thermomutatus TaxID=41047 RepID=A0A397H4Y6_ASPTH|nr:Non-classical phosphatidylinositol transfer protein (PITP) [Aspergillus thermomutatus]RHZ56696.1 Non-classical phosphatidylinositol transfer protein (PITP) [Aspergillus thermomutatus]